MLVIRLELEKSGTNILVAGYKVETPEFLLQLAILTGRHRHVPNPAREPTRTKDRSLDPK